MDYRNTNVVVTGSSAGIGKATAESYMKNGADVIIHGASLKGEEVARELNEKYDSKATFIRADLAKMEQYVYTKMPRMQYLCQFLDDDTATSFSKGNTI